VRNGLADHWLEIVGRQAEEVNLEGGGSRAEASKKILAAKGAEYCHFAAGRKNDSW
jgi:hypothetical protein